jgi:peroxiredoxin
MVFKLILILSLMIPATAIATSREGAELVGSTAPSLNLDRWVNSRPLEISELKGKVLLVRWWTDRCELCAATAPSLRDLQDEYGAKGLQVIGIFHPKPTGDWNLERVKRAAADYKFTFPIADDGDWKALKRWWLDGAHRDYTSVSFVIDKRGIIRYVHPGGEFHAGNGLSGHEICEADWKIIKKLVADLLAE